MIANARMYSVGPQAASLWRRLLAELIGHAGADVALIEHVEPAPIDELWAREDKAAVFMCGLPFSRSSAPVHLLAAPVPSPADFRGLPQYWSELVVRKQSTSETIEDTFGGKIALTVPDSQSGCLAALYYLKTVANRFPLYAEVVTPQITPLGALSAVIEGLADVAPIDSYAFCLLQKYRQDLTSQVRIVARTGRTPIPPLVASQAPDPRLQAAFLQAHENPALKALMAELLLERFVLPDPASYDALRLNWTAATQYWKAHTLAGTVHPTFAI